MQNVPSLQEIASIRNQNKRNRLSFLSNKCFGEKKTQQRITWIGDLQQGDGGKGAMVDRLAPHHNICVRVQGGDNAGHTSAFVDEAGNTKTLSYHIIPSGLRFAHTIGLLSDGVMVNPERLSEELDRLCEINPTAKDRLFIGERAHIVLPYHRVVDCGLEDLAAKTNAEIGTTRRGIGPANISKTNRIGIRVIDLQDMKHVRSLVEANAVFFGLPKSIVDESMGWIDKYRELLIKLTVQSDDLLRDAIEDGYSVLFEGAQGPLIDINRGIYPYVTTCPTAFYSVDCAAGVDAVKVDRRIGVLKAYQTMVGEGAFVTEDKEELGDRLRTLGNEFGTTTSRPRRSGWLDLVQSKWAVTTNCLTSAVITKLDVLDTFKEISVCVAYKFNDEIIVDFKPEHKYLLECRPIYKTFEGWSESTKDVGSYDQLPENAKKFVEFIGEYLEIPISGVSKGPSEFDLLARSGRDLDMFYSTL